MALVDENGNPLDPEIVALAKAIFRHETPGGKPIAGKSGEVPSRAQFLPATWKRLAREHLGDANAKLTPSSEREAVYKELKRLADGPYTGKERAQLKALGQTHFNVGNIASIWNGGKPARHMFSETTNELTGANSTRGRGEYKLHNGVKYYKRGLFYRSSDNKKAPKKARLIKYDVLNYVKKVHRLYKEFKGLPESQLEGDASSTPEENPYSRYYPSGLSTDLYGPKPPVAFSREASSKQPSTN